MAQIKTTIIATLLTMISLGQAQGKGIEEVPNSRAQSIIKNYRSGLNERREISRKHHLEMIQGLQKMMQPIQRKVKALAQRDSRFKQLQRELNSMKKRIARKEISPKEIQYMKKKYGPFVKNTMKKVKFKRMHAPMEKYIQSYALANTFIWGPLGELFARFENFFNPDREDETPADMEFNLELPFEQEILHKSNIFCNDCVSVDLETGEAKATATTGLLGYLTNTAGAAKVIDVPEGYSELRVVATVNVPSYSTTAFSDFIGVGQASVSTVLEVFGQNQVQCRMVETPSWIIAPLLWLAIESGTTTTLMECRVNLNGEPGQYLISTLVEAQASGFGLALGSSNIRAVPSEIKVWLEN